MPETDNISGGARSPRPRLEGTEPGDVVGGYELLREIGRGGMAEVWVARKARATTGKFVALKLILPKYVGDERYADMFRSEAEVCAPLSHGNIAQVFDVGDDNGRSYLVMEWVDGVDLARLLPDMAQLRQRDPYLRLRVAAYVIGQVLHGLSYAHKVTSHRGTELGIVHRDISPQNILISVSGDVKITDFGIAHRMSEETAGVDIKGKLRYMAPEHLGGKSHAPTVDLYAVGALLHELLDGEKFRSDAEDQLQLYRQVMDGVIPALRVDDVPPELDALRLALLHADARKRPQTADAALLLLKRWSGYSEMKVELSTICGLATGIMRPRTGPMIEPGAPTIPPPRAGVPRFVAPASPESDAPAAPWGVSLSTPASMVPTVAGSSGDDGTAVLEADELPFATRARTDPTMMLEDGHAPALVHGRDAEPTHSSVQARWESASRGAPAVEPTVSQLDVAAPDRSGRSRVMVLLGGFALLSLVGAGATAWVLAADGPTPAPDAGLVVGVQALERPASEPARESEPESAMVGPTLEPAKALADLASPPAEPRDPASLVPSPAPAPAPAPAPPTPTSTTTTASVEPVPAAGPAEVPVKPASAAAKPAKPTATKPANPAPAPDPKGPSVIVRFRLEGGLAGADVKLGSLVIKVRPRYDAPVPAGKYSAKWRANPDDAWKSAGSVMIGDSGEWKFFIGPQGARVSKL